MIRFLSGCLLPVVLMAGCTAPFYSGQSGSSPVIVEDRGPVVGETAPATGERAATIPVVTPEQVTRSAAEKPSGGAVLALLDQADTLQGRGDLDGAVVPVERALRIEPRNPAVYLRLATLRFQQNKVVQAEQLALKGLSYPMGAALQADFWDLIANCRDALGNRAGASAARQKASQLRSGRYS